MASFDMPIAFYNFSTTITDDKDSFLDMPDLVNGFVAVCLVFTIGITIHAMWELFCNDSSAWINKAQSHYTVWIMLSFTICMAIQYTIIVARDSTNTNIFKKQKPTYEYLVSVRNIFYWIGNILFYVLLLLKVTIPFDLNQCLVYSLSFIIFISGIASATYCILGFVMFNKNLRIWQILSITLLFNGIVLSLFVWSIFITKSKQTIFGIDPAASTLARKNVNIMMNVVAKHSLLFGIAMAFNPGYLVTVFLSATEIIMKGGYYSEFAVYGTAIAQTLEGFINVLVLWLILRKNYKKYIRCCKCCHICVAKCCFKNVDSKQIVADPYKDLLRPRLQENTIFLTSRKRTTKNSSYKSLDSTTDHVEFSKKHTNKRTLKKTLSINTTMTPTKDWYYD